VLAEWTKLTSVRATYVCLAVTLLLGVGLSSLAALGIGAAGTEALPPGVDPVEQAAALAHVGPVFGVIPLVVLAAQFSAREYPSQLRLTFAVHPRRGRVLLAKTVVLVGTVLAVGAVTVAAAFAASQAILESFAMPTVSLAEQWRTTLALGVTLPVFPLLALGLGTMLRSVAGTTAAVLAALLLPPMVSTLLPDSVQRHVLRYLPTGAWDNVVGATAAESPLHMDPWAALAVLTGWLALCWGAALRTLHRTDV